MAGAAILAITLASPPQSARAQSAALDQYSGVPGPTPQAAARARRAAGLHGRQGTTVRTAPPGAPERLPFTGYPLNRVVLAAFSVLVAALLLRAWLIVRARSTRAAAR